MSERSKKSTFVIILIFIFVLVAGYIAIKLGTIQRETSTYSDTKTQEILTCADYTFGVRNGQYDPETGDVYFEVNRGYGRTISNITAEFLLDGSDQELVLPTNKLLTEKKQFIVLEGIGEITEVYVYPENCPSIKEKVELEEIE